MCTNESSSKPIIVPFHFSQCIFLPSFLPPPPKTLPMLLKSRAAFFFKAQFPFHNSILLPFSVSGWFHLKAAAEDKGLNKIVHSCSIILLSKHGNFLPTPDLITRLLGEGCLSRCYLCATLSNLHRPSFHSALSFSLLQPFLTTPHTPPQPPLQAAVTVSVGLLPRIPESFSSLTNLSF